MKDKLLSLLLNPRPELEAQGWELLAALGDEGLEMLYPWRPVRLRSVASFAALAREWVPDFNGDADDGWSPRSFTSGGEPIAEAVKWKADHWRWQLRMVGALGEGNHYYNARTGSVGLADVTRPGILLVHGREELSGHPLLTDPLLPEWLAERDDLDDLIDECEAETPGFAAAVEREVAAMEAGR